MVESRGRADQDGEEPVDAERDSYKARGEIVIHEKKRFACARVVGNRPVRDRCRASVHRRLSK